MSRGGKPFPRRRARAGRIRVQRTPRSPAPQPVVQVAVTIVSATTGPSIVIRNRSAIVSDVDAWAYAAAQARQVNEHFALPAPLGWGLGVKGIRVETPEAPARPDEWLLLLHDGTDMGGALAYHDETGGVPAMIVSPQLNRQDGVPWTSAASHEVLETLADPGLSLAGVGWDGVVRALEVCDPVEADSYEIDGIALSDFVLPVWFDATESPDRFDWLGLVKQAGEIRPGGYCSVYAAGAWQDINASRRDGRWNRELGLIGRGARRRLRQGRTKPGSDLVSPSVHRPAARPSDGN